MRHFIGINLTGSFCRRSNTGKLSVISLKNVWPASGLRRRPSGSGFIVVAALCDRRMRNIGVGQRGDRRISRPGHGEQAPVTSTLFPKHTRYREIPHSGIAFYSGCVISYAPTKRFWHLFTFL
jgi:hypothetical protein